MRTKSILLILLLTLFSGMMHASDAETPAAAAAAASSVASDGLEDDAILHDDVIPRTWNCSKYFTRKSNVDPTFIIPSEDTTNPDCPSYAPSDETLLFDCSDVGEAKFLLDIGVDARATDSYGQNALFLSEDPEIIRLLVAAGADPHARSKSGYPILADCDSLEVAKVLVDEYGVDPNGIITPPLTDAVESATQIVKCSILDRNVYHLSEGHLSFYLEKGADPNLLCHGRGYTDSSEKMPVFMSMLSNFKRNCQEYTCSVNTDGMWPLGRVVDLIDLYVSHKADLSLKSTWGKTYMHCAPTPDAVRYLLTHGVGLDTPDKHGMTPLRFIQSHYRHEKSFIESDDSSFYEHLKDKSGYLKSYIDVMAEMVVQGAQLDGFSPEGLFDDEAWTDVLTKRLQLHRAQRMIGQFVRAKMSVSAPSTGAAPSRESEPAAAAAASSAAGGEG